MGPVHDQAHPEFNYRNTFVANQPAKWQYCPAAWSSIFLENACSTLHIDAAKKVYSSELHAGLPARLRRAEVMGALCDVSSKDANAAHPWGCHRRGRAGTYCRPPRYTSYRCGQFATQLSLTDRRLRWISCAGWVSPHFSAAAPPGVWAADADEAVGLGIIPCPPMQLYSLARSWIQPPSSRTPQSIRYVSLA